MQPVGNNFQTQSASAPAWHSSQDLCSAFVAAVVHVNELAARKRNVLARLHQRLAPWTLHRRQLLLGGTLVYLGLLPCAPLGPSFDIVTALRVQ
jgi:hypothetical protein